MVSALYCVQYAITNETLFKFHCGIGHLKMYLFDKLHWVQYAYIASAILFQFYSGIDLLKIYNYSVK